MKRGTKTVQKLLINFHICENCSTFVRKYIKYETFYPSIGHCYAICRLPNENTHEHD